MHIHGWAWTSVGSAAISFIVAALPILQLIAVAISIAAGIKALRSEKK